MTSNRSKGSKRRRTRSPELSNVSSPIISSAVGPAPRASPLPPSWPPRPSQSSGSTPRSSPHLAPSAPLRSSQSLGPISIMNKYSYEELIPFAQKYGLYVILPILKLSTKYAQENSGALEAPWYLPWMMVLLGFFSFNLDNNSSIIHAMPFPQHPVVANWDSTEAFLKAELDAATQNLGLSSEVSEQSTISTEVTTKLSMRIPDFVHKLIKLSATSDTTELQDQSIKQRRTILIVEIKGVTRPRIMYRLAQNTVYKQCSEQAWHVLQGEPTLRCVACIIGIGDLFHYREYYRDRLAQKSAPTDDGECIPSSPHYSSSDTIPSSPSSREPFTQDEEKYATPLGDKLYLIFNGKKGEPLFVSYLHTEGEELLLEIAKRLKEINEEFWSSSDSGEATEEQQDDDVENSRDFGDDRQDDGVEDSRDFGDEEQDDDEENFRGFEDVDEGQDDDVENPFDFGHSDNNRASHASNRLSDEEITSREGSPAEGTHHDHHALPPLQLAYSDEYDELRDDPPDYWTYTGTQQSSSSLGSPLKVAEDDSSDPLLGPVDP